MKACTDLCLNLSAVCRQSACPLLSSMVIFYGYQPSCRHQANNQVTQLSETCLVDYPAFRLCDFLLEAKQHHTLSFTFTVPIRLQQWRCKCCTSCRIVEVYIHTFLTWLLDGCVQLAARSGCFIFGKVVPITR